MQQITLEQLEAVKAGLEKGDVLKDLWKELEIQVPLADLNEALIRRYGAVNIGNPLQRQQLARRASRLIEAAKVELSKEQLLAVLSDLQSEAADS